MAKVNGLTLPNKQWEVYSPGEEAATIDLSPTGLLVLAYPGSSILRDKVQQDCRLWKELLGFPDQPLKVGEGVKLLVRPYSPNLREWDPTDWAFECLRIIDLYEEMGIPRSQVELIPANEMNREGWRDNWREMINWLNTVAGVVHFKSQETVIHIPALSPSKGDYIQGYRIFALYYNWDAFTRVDAHVYTLEQAAQLPTIQELFGLPLVVTEYNCIFPSTILKTFRQYEWFDGAYWFILHWDSPEPGAPDVDLLSPANAAYYQDFKNYKEEEPIPPMTKEELWDNLTSRWETYPALTKAILEVFELPIGEEQVVGDYTFQLGTGPVVAFARTGDWGNVAVATDPSQLPDMDAASH